MGNGYIADHADAQALAEASQRSYRMAVITDPTDVKSVKDATKF
jgi:hypothetical protein